MNLSIEILVSVIASRKMFLLLGSARVNFVSYVCFLSCSTIYLYINSKFYISLKEIITELLRSKVPWYVVLYRYDEVLFVHFNN